MRFGLFVLPLGIFLILAVFLWQGLELKPQELPSALIGRTVPLFQAGTVEDPTQQITDNIFKGQVSVLNVWSSGCVGCYAEHKLWMELLKQGSFAGQDGSSSGEVQLIGLNYHDTLGDAQRSLQQMGDPYRLSIFDKNGRLGMDFGVYGTPETFIVDKMGVIRYRQVGPIDKALWEKQLLPILKALE